MRAAAAGGPGLGSPEPTPPNFLQKLLKPLRDFGFGQKAFVQGGVGLFVYGGIGALSIPRLWVDVLRPAYPLKLAAFACKYYQMCTEKTNASDWS